MFEPHSRARNQGDFTGNSHPKTSRRDAGFHRVSPKVHVPKCPHLPELRPGFAVFTSRSLAKCQGEIFYNRVTARMGEGKCSMAMVWMDGGPLTSKERVLQKGTDRRKPWLPKSTA